MRHSLLDDPLIRVRTTDGDQANVRACALPQVLALLTDGRVRTFEALQPHQQQPWFSFLVQLAAMGVARENGGETPAGAAAWRDVLLGLSGGNETAWHLVVEDVAQPAFMQPPVPEGSLDEADYKDDVPTPDRLDMLITSKNHDVKRQRITRPHPEHWLFALCTLQTMEGFLGRGNYGVVRMNGGFGNRPMVGLTAGLAWGQRFTRDLGVLLDERDALADRYDRGGHALLWLDPWDGAKDSGIPLDACDPYFIEICRRIRFTSGGGAENNGDEITCWRANTKAQRVDAPDALNGRTGDPWTPIEKDDAKALTLGEAGFTYDRLQQIFLSGKYARPPALEFRESDRGGAYLVARTLVRGQGKTDGLHHRIVPVSEQVSGRLFSDPSERERLGKRAQQRVTLAADVQRQVLYPAIAALLAGGRDDADVDWENTAPWIDAFDRAVDTRFFNSLWSSVDKSEEAARADWQHILREEAERQFEDAKGSTPIASIHRWHARSKAQSIFEARAREVLDHAFETSSEPPAEAA